MRLISQFTSEFIEIEDRIRLLAKTNSGHFFSLWITQRLVIRLLPHLFSWLESIAQNTLVFDAICSKKLEQTSAPPDEAFASAKAIIATNQLIEAVNIISDKDKLKLEFVSTNSECSIVIFEELQLQQWLLILFKLSQGANWNSIHWPSWIPQINTNSSNSINILH